MCHSTVRCIIKITIPEEGSQSLFGCDLNGVEVEIKCLLDELESLSNGGASIMTNISPFGRGC